MANESAGERSLQPWFVGYNVYQKTRFLFPLLLEPGKFHGQRSLAGCRSKELDMTKPSTARDSSAQAGAWCVHGDAGPETQRPGRSLPLLNCSSSILLLSVFMAALGLGCCLGFLLLWLVEYS